MKKTDLWSRIIFLLIVGGFLSVFYLVWQSEGRNIPNGQMNAPGFAPDPVLSTKVPQYRFAVHPLHNPQRLFDNFQPIVDIINRDNHAFQARLLAARDYASFEKRLFAGEFDFALANPLQALAALNHGYEIVAKMGDDDNFCGIIIARNDSGFSKPADLNGKNMIFPAPTALAATLMPRYFMHELGVDLASVRSSSSGSQESAIMNVYLGHADAAGTWPMPWNLFLKERPELAREMKVLWRTEPLINNAILAKKGLPPEHIQGFVDSLAGLQNTADGKAALEHISLSCFETASDAEYAPKVEEFLRLYKKAFPDEQPFAEMQTTGRSQP